MKVFDAFVPGAPVAKQSSRHSVVAGRVHSYTPKHQKGWEEWCRGYFAEAWEGTPPLFQPLRLIATFVLVRPKTVTVKKRPLPTVKPDLTNMVKPVEDALELAGVVSNDSIIVAHHTRKEYAEADEAVGVYVQLDTIP